MGIFGAMLTAVSGLKAQSYGLENISGNIANSRTTGFKRVDTSFVDLIPDMPARREIAGSVGAYSRLTNTLQGDLQSTGVGTNMALNGEGYFIVGERSGYSNNRPIFANGDLFTRRGDFDVDKDGYLVNGTGHYLKGTSFDPTTGIARGGSDGIVQISRDPINPRATTSVTYRATLPRIPGTPTATSSASGSELLVQPAPAAAFGQDPTTGGTGRVTQADQSLFMSRTVPGGNIVVYNSIGAPLSLQLQWAKISTAHPRLPAVASGTQDLVGGGFTMGAAGAGNLTINGQTIALAAGTNSTAILNAINAVTGATGVTASLSPTNRLVLTHSDTASNIVVGGDAATVTRLGLTAATSTPTPEASDVWNLFYLADSDPATANSTTWQNVGVPITFDNNGQMTSTPSIPLSPLVIDGVPVGNVTMNFDAGGLKQFNSELGAVDASYIQQDGYTAGTLEGVDVTSDGRLVGSYSNGRSVVVGQVQVAQFNADNMLKRRDGGIFEQTLESGLPIIGLNGATIVGSNVEGSNTDIADEFSKMIVTQQAYSANTRVVSTSQQMLQDVLNMVR